MRRLTDLAEDPSRDPRVAILAALGRVIPANRSNELLAFMADVDDEVNAAAAKAFQAAGGIAAPTYPPKRRYPYQPTELAIRTLPIEATILLEQGTVVIALLPSEARSRLRDSRPGEGGLLQRVDVPPHRAELRRAGRESGRQRIRRHRAVHA
jgi:hypothetical protein